MEMFLIWKMIEECESGLKQKENIECLEWGWTWNDNTDVDSDIGVFLLN